VFLAGANAFTQSNQGTTTGFISDPAGAVVALAAIEVRNVETGVVFRGGTSATGNYVISVPRKYEIAVNVPGFKKFVQQNVQVIVASDTTKTSSLKSGRRVKRLASRTPRPC
jgi:Carboxypeptidase regulatory-like domain